MRIVASIIICLIVTLSMARAQETINPEPEQQTTTFDSFELPNWFKSSFLDLSEDNHEAHESNRHLMVMFFQQFCTYCKATIEKNLTQKSIRKQFSDHVDVVALNIWGDREVSDIKGRETTEKEIARALGVQFTPTLIFFDQDGQSVLRLNGYVSPPEMKIALNYVTTKTYKKQSIFDYLETQKIPSNNGLLKTEPFFTTTSDLSAFSQPRAVLFEQTDCPDCDTFHRCVLALDSVRERFTPFETIQLDLWSKEPITAPNGELTTARDYAKDLNITYAPSLIFFDEQGREIIRVDSQLRSFHTEAVLEYVADAVYLREPNFQRYIEERGDRIRAQGDQGRTLGTRDICPDL